MPKIRESLLPLPKDMAGCRVDHRGFPVPWFVTGKDANGNWDFVGIRPERFAEAERKNVCWVSGAPLGRYVSFVVGPMCVVNRVAGDPPVKRDVAEWSVKVCPFLSNPKAHRGKDVAEIETDQRGVMLNRNPGISAIYTTKEFAFDKRHQLYMMGEPDSITWWAEGRAASPGEVVAAMKSGLPKLEEMATAEGGDAVKLFRQYVNRALSRIPTDIAAQTPDSIAPLLEAAAFKYATCLASDDDISKYADEVERIYKEEQKPKALAEGLESR